jgi:hypothetical protein
VAQPALAHPHQAEPAENSPVHDADDTPLPGDPNGDVGQYLANGDTHAPFTFSDGFFQSCEAEPGEDPGQPDHPSGFGLETAHHGPDEGDAGKSDGCFAESNPPASPAADQNPAIG